MSKRLIEIERSLATECTGRPLTIGPCGCTIIDGQDNQRQIILVSICTTTKCNYFSDYFFFNYCNYEKFTFAGDFAKIQVAKGPLPCSKLRALFSTKRFVLSPHLRCSVMDHLRHGRKTQTSHQLGCEVKPRNCHDVNTVMERWGHTCLLFLHVGRKTSQK